MFTQDLGFLPPHLYLFCDTIILQDQNLDLMSAFLVDCFIGQILFLLSEMYDLFVLLYI